LRSFAIAIVLSLAAHAFLVGLLWSNAGRARQNGSWDTFDTSTGPPIEYVRLTLSDPKPRPKPIVPVVVSSPDRTVTTPSIPTPAPQVAIASNVLPRGPNEEQESAVAGHGLPASSLARLGPPGTTTAFFAIPTSAQRIVYVIDRSASMGPGGLLESAKRELLASLRHLPPTALFQVIVYNRQVDVLRINGSTELRQATERNISAVRDLLAEIGDEGSTDHLAALKRALLFQPEAIYFLTDAADLKPDQVQRIRALNQVRAAIHTVELCAAPIHGDETSLARLAAANGGAHRIVRGSE
jgi:hypothetical protein